jgi:predicted dehydrogenase
VYLDLDELLARERVDIAVVATPNDLHHPMVLAALESGAHVLCDKPLAMNATEARAMLVAATGRSARHVVPFWFRFLPAMALARELLASGELGEPRFVDVRFLNCGWGDPEGPMRWQFERRRAAAGAFANLGPHAVDAVHWLGGDLERVAAVTALSVPERRWPDGRVARPDVEDTGAFVGTLVGGAPVSFLASSVAYAGRSVFSIAVHASAGAVTVHVETDIRSARLVLMRRGDAQPHEVPMPAVDAADLADAAYDAIAAELVAAIREGRAAVPGFREGLRAQVVLDAAVASAAAGSWTTIDYGMTTGSDESGG